MKNNVILKINVVQSDTEVIFNIRNSIYNYDELFIYKNSLLNYGYISKGKKGLYKNCRLLQALGYNPPKITIIEELKISYFNVEFKIKQ